MHTTLPIAASPFGTPSTADDPWLAWRPDLPREGQTLSIAELADCHCPELCDRDHANE